MISLIWGLPFPTPENLPDPGTEPASPVSLAVAGGFFTTEPLWKSVSTKSVKQNYKTIST